MGEGRVNPRLNKKVRLIKPEVNGNNSRYIPAINDPSYLEYETMITSSTELEHDHEVMEYVNPPSKSEKKIIRKQEYAGEIEKLMLGGIVWKCRIHKIATSQLSNKYQLYNHPTHVIDEEGIDATIFHDVVVDFGHLCNTLIPTKEKVIQPAGKRFEKVRWGQDEQDRMDCFVESSGVRCFWKDGQTYYRIGDLLSMRVIVNCIAESGSTANFLYYWLWCCMHSHEKANIDKATSSGAVARRKKRKKVQIIDEEMVTKLKSSAAAASQFASDVVEAVDVCGLPKTVLRIHWMDMNVLDEYYDTWRGEDMKNFCEKERKRMAEVQGVEMNSTAYKDMVNKLKKTHLMIIMVASFKQKDEVLREQYLRLMQGRLSPKQFLLPLTRVAFFTYFSHLKRALNNYSLYNKRAEGLLRFIAIVQCKYGGNLPIDANVLLAFPNIGKKMVSVVLNSLGFYASVGLGPGVDSHVKRNWEYFLIEMGVIRNLAIRVVQMSPYIRVNPGMDLK